MVNWLLVGVENDIWFWFLVIGFFKINIYILFFLEVSFISAL